MSKIQSRSDRLMKRPNSRARIGASRSSMPVKQSKILPILRKCVLSTMAFFVVSALVLGSYKAMPYFSPDIKHVIVEGELKRLNEALLSDAIFENIEGGILNLDIALLQSRVAEVPWVESVEVVKNFPATIIVNVTEEQAIARWNNQGYISAKGEYIYSALYDDLAHLPRLSSDVAGLQPELGATEAINIFHMLNSVVLMSGQQITELQQSSIGGWLMTWDNGLSIDLGRVDHLTRTRHAMSAWQRLPIDVRNDIDQIDARYANGVAVRPRKQLAEATEQSTDSTKSSVQGDLKTTDNPA